LTKENTFDLIANILFIVASNTNSRPDLNFNIIVYKANDNIAVCLVICCRDEQV